MSKFKAGDIVLCSQAPIVILGEHIFPDGTPAYRFRDCLPQYDMTDGEELWINRDAYLSQKFVDTCVLIWRKE